MTNTDVRLVAYGQGVLDIRLSTSHWHQTSLPRGRSYISEPADVSQVEAVRTESGGTAANTAAAVAALGFRSRYVGAFASDSTGAKILDSLVGSGVEVDPLWDESATSTVCFVEVTDGNEPSMATQRGSVRTNQLLVDNPRPITSTAFVEAYLLADPLGIRFMEQLSENVHDSGQQLALALCSSAVARELRDTILHSLNLVDVLFCNQFEAAAVTGETDPIVAAKVLQTMVATVFVTMEHDGAVVASNIGASLIRGVPTNVADPTGAGDQFAAAALLSLGLGQSAEAAARAGNAVASVGVTAHGNRLPNHSRKVFDAQFSDPIPCAADCR